MLRACLVLLGLIIAAAAGPGRAEFGPPGLGTDAATYAGGLRAKAPPQAQPAQRDAALAEARAALARGDSAKAVAAFEKAATLGADGPAFWLDLSEAWNRGAKANPARALQSALLAYQAAGDAATRVAPLHRLADLLEPERPALALDALRALAEQLAEVEAADKAEQEAALQGRLAALRQRVGLVPGRVTVTRTDATPRACIAFNEPLSGRADVRFEDFLKVEPAAPLAASSSGSDLCITGFNYGTSYQVLLRQGLPGADGLALKADAPYKVWFGDREPSVAFRGNGFILPRQSGDGIPLTAINVDRVGVEVYRINDRGLAPALRERPLLDTLSRWDGESIAENAGEKVWAGTLDVPAGPRNAEVTTPLSFRKMVPEPQPGVYLITAEPQDVADEQLPYYRATQWVLVTDLGLTAMEGADGLTVFARSFATARPVAGVEVALVARNNAELARLTTDAEGRVRFPVGLAHGTGGRSPMLVMAYLGADYALLSLTGSAFDLSDRGVSGRPAPGPMDPFLYTDRGVYRQGETVNLGILLRDDLTTAVEGLPLTVKVLRPSGTEYSSTVVTSGPGGGAALPIALSRTAPLGGWTIELYADPKANPIGTAGFQVDDFVPERLAVELTPRAPYLQPGTPLEVLAKARFLYGPPAAGLDGSAEVALQPDPNPYPQHPGYRFGLAQETVTTKVEEQEFPGTDEAGQAVVSVDLPPLPDTTRPLRAEIRVSVAEPGGRPTRQSVIVPVRTQPFAIGLKPRFEGGRIGEGQAAGFEVLALAPDGTPTARSGLAWELIEEQTTFHWYYADGRYNYRATRRDRSLKAGTLAVAAGAPTALEAGTLPYGRYRIEVADKASGVATSVRFNSGWQPSAEPSDRPDTLEVTSDRQTYRPGETARVRIVPPFAGEVLLTVATDKVLSSRTLTVAEAGTTVEIPVEAGWGPGAYVTATAYRPPVKGRERQPVRAIGLTWLAIDPADRTLTVSLEAPDVVRPRQPLEVAVRVAQSGPAEEAYVTLAAVDEGILQLTDFTSPDPGAHYFGKRRLGVDIRDDYGRLIDPLDGPYGPLRQGGDASGAGLPVVPFTVVSLFHGPVKVGADGLARITLSLPDFNGELRLMAVAYSKTRVGSAARPLTVRDPLVADAALPRFLAPGDDSRVTLNIHNVEAAAGAYAIRIDGYGSVAVDNGALLLDLPTGERRTAVLPLKGLSAGIGRVTLSVRGPDGLTLEHGYDITVRPSRPVETQFTTAQVAPGGQSRFGLPSLASYLPGTAAMTVSLGAGPPFDVGGILQALDRYPFGCLEQTISRALPLLYVRDVEMAIGAAPKPDQSLEVRIQQAVARTLDKQRYDGTFGLWGPSSEGETWLTAYALEFLVRARAKGYTVPDAAMHDGIDWLRRHAVDGGTDTDALASRAYALHVLALAGVATPSPARYFYDGFRAKLPTPLAKAQIGAALARLGDKDRAAAAFRAAADTPARETWHADYGSTIRDAAAIIALASEVGMAEPILPALLDRLPASATAARLTNTQEQAWLVLAAESLTAGTQPPRVTVSGRASPSGPPRGGRVSVVPTQAELASGITVTNAGAAPLWQAVSVSGVPAEPRPAAREGLRVKRNFLTRTGEPLNLDDIHQNDVFVIVLEGEATTKLFHQAVITHPLPAGWEIENARLGSGSTSQIEWLGELSAAQTIEARDDRYVAAIDLTEESPTFKLAYLVRAVTPGTYELPGAVLEDMYKPNFFARQGVGRITVLPAR